jgi:hypothetical protein
VFPLLNVILFFETLLNFLISNVHFLLTIYTSATLNAAGEQNLTNNLIQSITYNENNDPIKITGKKAMFILPTTYQHETSGRLWW